MTVIGKRNSGVVQEPTIFEFYSPWSSGGHLRLCGTDIVQEENAMSEVQFQSSLLAETSWHLTSLSQFLHLKNMFAPGTREYYYVITSDGGP